MFWEILAWLTIIGGIIGASSVCVFKKPFLGNFIWVFSNAVAVILNFIYYDSLQQSILFFIYFVLSIIGIYQWRKG